MIVIDASVALASSFKDERTAATVDLIDRVARGGAVVPSLWRLEVANAFRTAIRRGRIDAGQRDAALEQFSALPVETDPETSAHAWSATLALSDRHGLTPYDAAYLELAQRRRLPLATLDAALASAAAKAGVEIIDMS